MDNLLDGASHCPICDRAPISTHERILDSMTIFLQCPAGHPYTFGGKTFPEAISNWNKYISLRIQFDSQKMIQTAAKNLNMSFCRNCEKPTKSITYFDKTYAARSSYGCTLVIHKCADCLLTKSEKDVA